VIAHRVTGAPGAPWRITITPPVIEAAAEVVFLVSGSEKAATLRRVLEGPYEPDVLPAQAVTRATTRVHWLVDADAAAELRKG
jgi:6-phosphogluconolactonase